MYFLLKIKICSQKKIWVLSARKYSYQRLLLQINFRCCHSTIKLNLPSLIDNVGQAELFCLFHRAFLVQEGEQLKECDSLHIMQRRTRQRCKVKAWSSFDKEESLACQVTSPFTNKLGWFKILKICLLLNGWSYMARQWLLHGKSINHWSRSYKPNFSRKIMLHLFRSL